MSGAHGGSSAALDQKADIAYVDSVVAGALRDRGNYDASGNTFPASGGSGAAGAIKQGDLWYISVAGTLGSVAVGVGDTVRALVDTPGQTAGNWAVFENNLGYVPERSIDAASAKTTPVDADTIGLIDSAASNVLKKLTFANLKAWLKSYFDTLYASIGSGGITLLTSAAASGTSVSFNIPAGAKKIVVMLNGVSLGNAGANLLVQIGDSGGTETTGYTSTSTTVASSTPATIISSAAYILRVPGASYNILGDFTLNLFDASTFTWVGSGVVALTDGTNHATGTIAGAKSLSDSITTLTLSPSAGSFDGGNFNLQIEM
jgi:hypothetical protein